MYFMTVNFSIISLSLLSQGYTDLWMLDIDPGGIVVIFAKKQEKIWRKNYFQKKQTYNIYLIIYLYTLSCTKYTRSNHKNVLIDC